MSIQARFFYALEYLLIIMHSMVIVLILGQNRLIFPPILEILGRMHPLLLHFPIVLLILAALIHWLGKHKIDPNIRDHFLLTSVLLTGLTVIAGFLLSSESGYNYENIKWHQWTAVALFWLSSVWYWFYQKNSLIVHKLLPLAILALVIITGHLGATITHGEDFLLEPLTSKKSEVISMEDALAFDHVIKPIFEQKCISCHKASKQKGELRLDEAQYILAGGKTGLSISADQPEESLLIKRIHLPLDDEEHMPPKEKAQLNEEEIELITAWIMESAHFDKKILAYEQSSVFANLAKTKIEKNSFLQYDFPPAAAKTIQELNTDYRLIRSLTPSSPALEVRFFGKNEFDSKKLEELGKIQKQIVSLNLSNMNLQEGDLIRISKFENLEYLNLNFTNIKGENFGELKELKSLKQIALSGNPLSEESFKMLSDIPILQTVYLWNTGLSDEVIKKFQNQNPNLKLIVGFQDDGVAITLNQPFIEYDSIIFRDSQLIRLKHPIGSTNIYYTLDGSEPDSLKSLLYKEPFTLEKSSTIKAKAFAKGWIGSANSQAVLFKAGRQPNKFNLTYEPNAKYSGNGAVSLFDLIKGDEDFASGKWLGFQENPFEITMEFENQDTLQDISLSILSDEGSHIFLPAKIEAWQKARNGNWVKIYEGTPEQPQQNMGKRYHLEEIKVNQEIPSENIKIKLSPVASLPSWHPSRGSKGWVFVDEILIN